MAGLDHSFSLDAKNVLVTGATGYLGRSMVLGLAKLGATVLVNGRRHEQVTQAVSELICMGYKALPAVFDVTDEADVESWFLDQEDLALHGLVNNAYRGASGSVETASKTDYLNSLEMSVIATNMLVQSALPNLRKAVLESGNASIVNIATMYGIVSPDQRIYENKKASNPPFYGVSKAALLQWTRYAACEFGREGIRVNAISPGPFPSNEVQTNNPGFIKKLSKKVPMGRIGRSEEIRGPLSFLISDSSSFVNGSNLVVDGGWTCW